MSKLLKANFYKLFHSRFFWVAFFVMPCLNLYFSVSDSEFLTPHEIVLNTGEVSWWGWNFYQPSSYSAHLFYMSYVVMAVIALFIGDEFSSGAVRNKILAGHSRTKLYLSYYITSFAGMMLIHLVSEIIGLGYCLIRYGTGFYDKYEIYYVDESLSECLGKDLLFFAKLNITAVIVIAALVGIVLICMIAIGRKAPGFVTAIILDVVSTTFVDDKISDLKLYYNSTNAHMEKLTLTLMSFDPNGFLQALLYGKYFIPCMICCLLTVCVLIAVGVILTNKREMR